MMGKLRKEFVFLLWQYIVTLEHGTHFSYAFITWVIHLSTSPTNTLSLLTSFELSKNNPTYSCIGGLVSVSSNSILPSHAMRMFKRNLVIYMQLVYLLSCWSSLSQFHTSLCCSNHFKHLWSCFMSTMGDSSWPSFDESIPVDFESLSRN